ncbi:MAG TPA: tail fiber domain-containing protein [Solirubrobacteraceae bacterium]|nr:tail fiber domain-containing protein [Solirubrobacteraceae bacterium]
MRSHSHRSTALAAVLASFAALGLAAGPALAGGGMIHACANRRTGALRLAARCRRDERPVVWSFRGPAGAQGAAGAPGKTGPAGPAGPAAGPATGALSGSYPGPTLNITGADNGASGCKNGEALISISPLAVLSCGPGVYVDSGEDVGVAPSQLSNAAFGSLTTGHGNTAVGFDALLSVTSGAANTASGAGALYGLTSGQDNAATGFGALSSDTMGGSNTGMGSGALHVNQVSDNNAAFGYAALGNATTGPNSAFGANALVSDTSGLLNTAVGRAALSSNTVGSQDVAVGDGALLNDNGSNNAVVGQNAGAQLTGGSGNTLIGENAGANLTGADSDNIDIGSAGQSGDTGVIRIGGSSQSSLYIPAAENNVGTTQAAALEIDTTTGQIGVATSSERFKTDIRALGRGALSRLMMLRPVSYRYRAAYVHGPNPLQYGLIAEQVARVYPNLVARDARGRPYTVLYQELPVLLLAQVQRQQRELRALRTDGREIRHLQAEVAALMRRLG